MDPKPDEIQDSRQSLAIAATFTSEPVEEALGFWIGALDLPFEIEFAPYNQVFQQLLEESSLLRGNATGVNVVLVRFEDWQRFDPASQGGDVPCFAHDKVESHMRQLVGALRSAVNRSAASYLVLVCPPSPEILANGGEWAFHQRIELLMSCELEAVPGVHFVMSEELRRHYPVNDWYDAQAYDLGHVPYTSEFFTALGTVLVRKVCALRAPSRKVIVLDADQTLWSGVCAEDGPDGVCLDGPRQVLQEFMLDQYHNGRLLCLCSKNDEADVLDTFSRHPEMPLKRAHFVASRVNWSAKSENLKSLADELHLGLDSFIFVDDNAIERAEVQSNCPEVLVLPWPVEVSELGAVLANCWAFDHLKVTAEDQNRTLLYRQNLERERYREHAESFESFLDGLGLKVDISPIGPEHFVRAAQLTLRTNQFNCTGRRRSESELQEVCAAEGVNGFVVRVSDRFGDYGLVGLMICEVTDQELAVDTFLLSCRALGRGVEQRMLATLGSVARSHGKEELTIAYVSNNRNRPALQFLETIAPSPGGTELGTTVFRLPAENALALFDYRPGNGQSTSMQSSRAAFPAAPDAALSLRANDLTQQMRDTRHILAAIREQKRRTPERRTAFVEPQTPMERELAGIWAELLHTESVGLTDHFLELGGNSLLVLQMLLRINDSFDVNLQLKDLLINGLTLPGAVELVEDALLAQASSQQLEALLGDLAGLSDESVGILLGGE